MRFRLKMCQFGQVKSDENASVIENILFFVETKTNTFGNKQKLNVNFY